MNRPFCPKCGGRMVGKGPRWACVKCGATKVKVKKSKRKLTNRPPCPRCQSDRIHSNGNKHWRCAECGYRFVKKRKVKPPRPLCPECGKRPVKQGLYWVCKCGNRWRKVPLPNAKLCPYCMRWFKIKKISNSRNRERCYNPECEEAFEIELSIRRKRLSKKYWNFVTSKNKRNIGKKGYCIDCGAKLSKYRWYRCPDCNEKAWANIAGDDYLYVTQDLEMTLKEQTEKALREKIGPVLDKMLEEELKRRKIKKNEQNN